MTARRLASLAVLVAACLLGIAAAPAGAGVDGAPYAQTVASTPGLAAYWRLGEAPGATAAADAANTWPATYAATTLGATGALSGDADTAAGFAGSASVSAGSGPAFAAAMTVRRGRARTPPAPPTS